jgi:uncharacterized protein
MITDPLFYAAAIPAVTLMGLAKGGFAGIGLLSLPLMALVVPPVKSAAIMLPILLVQDVVTVFAYRHSWDRRNVGILLPSALVGILAGYILATWVSDAAVRLAVGAISIFFAMRRLILNRRPRSLAPAPADVPRGVLWGIAMGFASMIAHAGGPPFQIYVMPQHLPRDIFVGTGAVLFALVNWSKVPPYIALGQFSPENLGTAAALFPIAVASTWAGVLLVRRVPGERFYTLVYLLLVLVGLKLVWDGASALIS